MISTLKKVYPKLNVDLIDQSSTFSSDILGDTKLINNIYKYDRMNKISSTYNLWSELKEKNFDAVFIPFDSSPKLLILLSFFLTGKKIIHNKIHGKKISFFIRFLTYINNLLFKNKFNFVDYRDNIHEIDLNYDLLESLCSKSFNSSIGNASISARSPILLTFVSFGASLLPCNVPITPVFAIPRVTSTPHDSNLFATISDVRVSSNDNSGCIWKS